MQLVHRITRTLHEEHLATMGLLDRMDDVILAHAPDSPPKADEIGMRNLLGDMRAAISSEVRNHFKFEEEGLFPLLEAAGNGIIGELLTEDHRILLPIGEKLVEHAKQAAQEGFGETNWLDFRRLVAEFIERFRSHIYREETGLVPVLDEILDEDLDRELANQYAESR